LAIYWFSDIFDFVPGAGALSNLSFWVTSFPRRPETSAAIWIPACAGMTVNLNFKSVNLNFK
jgi:hypothetical protein